MGELVVPSGALAERGEGPPGVWAALFSETVEVSGGGYGRLSLEGVPFEPRLVPNRGGEERVAMVSTRALSWPVASGKWGRVTHFALMRHRRGGPPLLRTLFMLEWPLVVDTFVIASFPPGQMVIFQGDG